MAREYIPKKWTWGRPAWERAKNLVRDYDRLRREREDIIYSSHRATDGQPRGSGTGRPTESAAARLERLGADLEAIDQASVEMRGELGHKVRYDFNPVRAFWSYDYFSYQHIRRDAKEPGDSPRSWNRYKAKFMIAVARRAKII